MDKREPNQRFAEHSYDNQSEFSDADDAETDYDNRSFGQDEQFEDSILFDECDGQSTPIAPAESEANFELNDDDWIRQLSPTSKRQAKNTVEQAKLRAIIQILKRENKALKEEKREMVI